MLEFPRFYPDQVVPSNRFGDRESQRRQIEYTLDAIKECRPRGGMICGERGIGKTSLLDKAEDMCLKRHILPLHIALHEFENVKEFYDTIFEEMGSALKKIGLWEKLHVVLGKFSKDWDYIVRVEKRPRTLQGEVDSRLSLLLEKMKKRGYKSLVFLLDESDGLKEYIIGLQILRNVWTSLCQRGYQLGFFFAGSKNLVEHLGQYSPLKRHCIPIQLKRFVKEECLIVINKLEEEVKHKLSNDVKMRIANFSGGYPHHIHILGDYAVQAMKKGSKEIWLEAFRNYLLEINEYESVIKRSECISETQKRILIHMDPFNPTTPKIIAKRSNVSQATIPAQLQRLIGNKVVKKEGRGDYEIMDRSVVEYLRLNERQ
ncbi:MAG: ATP-binding protein [Elusimicrobia bacterium]|nr:ATP-binding protein [Elusimicrobiota bacterium]